MSYITLESVRAHHQDLLRVAERERIATKAARERRPLRYRFRLGWPVRHRDALLPATDS